ncbi:HERV-H LTR-associating protein 1 [Petaurus breviceps papuanus]|uniref:HERV-H LTR-associating protein 1 n=1 Tax=Petaurus breviceps papuanus TaxID=3040969 RepID=UPI0036DEE520
MQEGEHGKISLESGAKEGELEQDVPDILASRAVMYEPRSTIKGESKKEKGVAFLATTELPARTVDLSTVNLTELVNGMLTKALKDSKKFFSLLSITSHSSFAFHKFSVVIYNISNLKIVDPTKFPTRHCYCLNNQTNDLSDFTALLVDIIGNSTSYLTEIFKSTSILSVSQSTESNCIYICVMTGKTGRNLSDFWEMVEKSPVINYTFTSNVSGILVLSSSPSLMALTLSKQREDMTNKFLLSADFAPTLISPSQSQPSPFPKLHLVSTDFAPSLISPSQSQPSPFPKLHLVSRCPQPLLKDKDMTTLPLTLSLQKINPCIMELCRFFQQCLCVGQKQYSRKDTMRFCIEYYSWFLRNATYICQRVTRMAHSHTLKQKCLSNICTSV